MSKCRRCNRELKREPWKSLGIGKICKAKSDAEREKQSNESGDVYVAYDGGDIWMERLASPTYGNDGQLHLAVHSCSGIKTNVQWTEKYHSPSGLNFGYGGSGPADMALNILLMFTDKETAYRLHQDFKWEYLAVDGNRIAIPKKDILDFITSKTVAA